MKLRQLFCLALPVLVASQANAITPSVFVNGSPLVNPFTGQATDVWKLVGKLDYGAAGSCSAVQVTREWVVGVGHCSIEPGTVFTNGYSTDPQGSTFICEGEYKRYENPFDDISACRLANPERFASPTTYPPLLRVSASEYPLLDRRGAGSSLSVGYSGGVSPSANFGVGAGDSLYGTNAYNRSCPRIIQYDGGDSGGGVYWFPPGSNQVGLIDIVSGPIQLDWLLNKISQSGTPMPVVSSLTDLAGAAALQMIPPPLDERPTIVVNSGGVRVTWKRPALLAGDNIGSYHFYEGPEGECPATRDFFVSSAVRSVQTSIVASNTTSRRFLCVVPHNNGQESSATYSCDTYDARIPVASNSLNFSVKPVGAFRKVRLDWSAPSNIPSGAPGDPGLTYRVSFTVKSLAGTSRVTTVTTQSLSAELPVQAKSQVCATVTASTKWAEGAPASKCVTVN